MRLFSELINSQLMNLRLALGLLRLVTMATVVMLLLLSGGILAQAINTSNIDGSPSWVSPTVTAMKRIGPAPNLPNQPNFQSNLDCTPITYHLVGDTAIQTGCFMTTAYGLVDPDSEVVIFNSTDEGLPLIAYLSHQVLTPWPGSEDVLSLHPIITGGAYIGLYRNLLSRLEDQRNILGGLMAKSLVSPPDFMLTNTDSSYMIINPQTMAFSANSSWLVVETLTGSFLRINLATLDITAFAPAFGSQGSPALLKSQVSISSSGRFVVIENDAANSFKVYDLSTCRGDRTLLKPLDCKSYEYLPYVEKQIDGLRNIRHLRFVNEELLSFIADHNGGSDVFELSPKIQIVSATDYLAVGDSYTSGEGAFDYLSETDTATNSCHLSLHSYPLQITQLIYGASGGHSVACSGAKIGDIFPSSQKTYRGQASDSIVPSQISVDRTSQLLSSFMPGYLPQSDFVTHYQAGIITVSVGGNDIGFSEILKSCVIPHLSLHLSDSVCYSTYEDRLELINLINRTVPKWAALFEHLASSSPVSKIYAIGYPQIFYDKGNCPMNVKLSKSELEFSAEIIDYLNGAIEQATSVAGVNYVDVSQALFGYRLCETASYSVAVNGLTAGKDGGVLGLKIFGNESYHPNAFGQSLIKNAILDKTRNFTVGAGIKSQVNTSQTLLNVPVSGRSIYTLIPSSVGQLVIDKGKTSSVYADGASYGLKPLSSYSVSLDRGKTSLTVSLITDIQGNISADFVLPSEVSVGVHSLDIIGTNQASENIDIRQVVYVSFSEQDTDGDGIINSLDSCIGEVNSGIDTDNDKIDDVCDSFIGPSINSSSGSVNVSGGLSSNGLIVQEVGRSHSDTGTSSTAGPQPVVQKKQTAGTQTQPVSSGINSLVNSTNTGQAASYRNLNFVNWLKSTLRIASFMALSLLVFWIIKSLKDLVRLKFRYRNIYRLGKGASMIS